MQKFLKCTRSIMAIVLGYRCRSCGASGMGNVEKCPHCGSSNVENS